jgi:hypothetical protein
MSKEFGMLAESIIIFRTTVAHAVAIKANPQDNWVLV